MSEWDNGKVQKKRNEFGVKVDNVSDDAIVLSLMICGQFGHLSLHSIQDDTIKMVILYCLRILHYKHFDTSLRRRKTTVGCITSKMIIYCY